MQMKFPVVSIFICVMLLAACSKKHQPQTEIPTVSLGDSVAVKPVVKKTYKAPVNKRPVATVLTVNDKGAKKSVDGRLYYDLKGYRYWRNYDDGKYYLFNSTMFNDPAFKPH